MSTPTPDYGEPWKKATFRDGGILNRHGQPILHAFELAKRAVICTNACAGIPYPAAHLAKLDEAIELIRRVSTSAATPNDAWEWLKQHNFDK